MAGVKLLTNTYSNGQGDATVDAVINNLLMPDVHQALFDDFWGYSEVWALMYNTRFTKIYGIFHEGKPEPIGVVFFTGVVPHRNCTLYACMFSKEHRGKGKLNSVIDAIKVDFRIRFHPHSVEAKIIGKNEATLHLLKKLGFKEIGVKKKAILSGGRYRDLTEYYLLLEEA